MFNFLSKPKSEKIVETKIIDYSEPQVVFDVKGNYPKIVHDIHNEFNSAGDNLVQQANDILDEAALKGIEKSKRLTACGFKQSSEVIVAENIINTKEAAELVRYYHNKYPFYKFINKEQASLICSKYGLVMGFTSAYKGFVPETKLSMIENFKVDENDVLKETWSIGVADRWRGEELNDEGQSANSYTSLYRKEQRLAAFRICAPLKDMDIKATQRVIGNEIKDIPDPVVLQPVKGGYLIVCAWGDESSDEIVVNETMN